jgi:hypothetical protein
MMTYLFMFVYIVIIVLLMVLEIYSIYEYRICTNYDNRPYYNDCVFICDNRPYYNDYVFIDDLLSLFE